VVGGEGKEWAGRMGGKERRKKSEKKRRKKEISNESEARG
jgi:hypothetical protein